MIRAHASPSAISGVLYAEDFDEPLLPAVAPPSSSPVLPEPELIEPRFSLGELRAATEQAREDAVDTERRAAASSLAMRRGAALASLAEQISLLRVEASQSVERALDALARTSLSLLAAALPALCAAHAESELRTILRSVLPPLRQMPELHIRIHPSLRAAIQNEVETLLEGSGAQVSWTESSKLQPGDVAVSWQNGAVLRDTGAICAKVREATLSLFDCAEEIPAPEIEDGQ